MQIFEKNNFNEILYADFDLEEERGDETCCRKMLFGPPITRKDDWKPKGD